MINKNPHSIDCATASEWLHSMLDEELQEAERRLLLAHLESCPSCAAAWHELKIVERSHARLDSRLLKPPADYFTHLPERIMARLESEKMVAPAILELPVRKARVLWLQKLAGGKARYALALAAAGAAIFFLVRSRSEAPVTTTAPQQNVLRDSLAFAAAEPFRQVSLEEQDVTLFMKDVKPPARATHPMKEEAKTAATAGRRRVAAPAAGEWQQGHQPPAATAPLTKPAPSELAPDAAIAAAAPESSHLALPGVSAESYRSAETRDLLESESREPVASGRLLQETPPARSAQLKGVDVAKMAVPADARSLFAQALRQAQDARDEATRQEIWWRYLQTGPDTAYYNLAAALLARSLAGSVDSTSSIRQIEQAAKFYRQQEAILAPQLGTETFRREFQRLEGLLQWRKASEGRNRPK